MTRSVVAPTKRSDARIPIEFPFADQLQFGETISGQAVTCVVSSGTDPTPSNVLFGAPTLSGTNVTQVVTAGVEGVIYQLVCAVTGSLGHIYTKGAKLAVVNDPEAFNEAI